MATRAHVVGGQDGARAQFMLDAEIKLIGVGTLHVWIGVPVKAGKWAGPGNRWARAAGGLGQTRSRRSVEWVQAATELASIRPRSLIVLSTLRNGGPVVVKPAISGSPHRSARPILGEPASWLGIREVILKDGAVGMWSHNHVRRKIALPWLRVRTPWADAKRNTGRRRIGLCTHWRQVRQNVGSVVKV